MLDSCGPRKPAATRIDADAQAFSRAQDNALAPGRNTRIGTGSTISDIEAAVRCLATVSAANQSSSL
jgi:hypothetical protein